MNDRIPAVDLPETERLKRIAVFKHYLALTAVIRGYQSDLDLAMISFAVAVGELEGRPLDVSALAVTVGLPRSTVQRKIETLISDWGFSIERTPGRTIVKMPDSSRSDDDPFIASTITVMRQTYDALKVAGVDVTSME